MVQKFKGVARNRIMRQRRKEKELKEYSSPSDHVTEDPRSDKSNTTKGVFEKLLHIFDCFWTCVLLLAACVSIIIFIPSLRQYLYGTAHVYAYQMNRYVRLGFIAVHPYMLYGGLDFTKQCLVQNPLANDTTKCPCIDQPYPNVIPINYSSLPEEAYNNPYNVYILKSIIPIEDKEYGRETLLEYLKIHGRIPRASFVTNSGSDGPLRMQQLIKESKWKHLNTSWDFSWVEFVNDESIPPISSLLPPLDSLFKGYVFTVNSSGQYSISTQWGKSMPYFSLSKSQSNDRMIFLVVQGTVMVKVSASHHCWEYCRSTYRGSLLYPGDALLYDERSWTFKTQTWSNKSFTVLKKFTIEK